MYNCTIVHIWLNLEGFSFFNCYDWITVQIVWPVGCEPNLTLFWDPSKTRYAYFTHYFNFKICSILYSIHFISHSLTKQNPLTVNISLISLDTGVCKMTSMKQMPDGLRELLTTAIIKSMERLDIWKINLKEKKRSG